MKMKKPAGLVAILLLCLAVPAVAQEWIYMGDHPSGGEIHLNRRSVEDHGNYVTGWVRADLGNAAKSDPMMQFLTYVYGREPSHMMMLYGAQKSSRQTRLIQLAFYDRNGSIIRSDNSGTEWKYCVPGTGDEVVWQTLMSAAGIRY